MAVYWLEKGNKMVSSSTIGIVVKLCRKKNKTGVDRHVI